MSAVVACVSVVAGVLSVWSASRAREAAENARGEAKRWARAAAEWERSYYVAMGVKTPRVPNNNGGPRR